MIKWLVALVLLCAASVAGATSNYPTAGAVCTNNSASCPVGGTTAGDFAGPCPGYAPTGYSATYKYSTLGGYGSYLCQWWIGTNLQTTYYIVYLSATPTCPAGSTWNATTGMCDSSAPTCTAGKTDTVAYQQKDTAGNLCYQPFGSNTLTCNSGLQTNSSAPGTMPPTDGSGVDSFGCPIGAVNWDFVTCYTTPDNRAMCSFTVRETGAPAPPPSSSTTSTQAACLANGDGYITMNGATICVPQDVTPASGVPSGVPASGVPSSTPTAVRSAGAGTGAAAAPYAGVGGGSGGGSGGGAGSSPYAASAVGAAQGVAGATGTAPPVVVTISANNQTADYCAQNPNSLMCVNTGNTANVADPNAPGAADMPTIDSNFTGLLAWRLPGHTSTCPQPSVDLSAVFKGSHVYVFNSHCALVQNNFAIFAAVMVAVWTVLAMFIVLKA